MLGGDALDQPVEALVCSHEPWGVHTVTITPERHTGDARSAVFHFRIAMDGHNAAQFAMRYALDHATLTVTMENVLEQPGFQLIEVRTPRLVSVRDSDAQAWLAHGEQGGHLVMLADAHEGTLKPNTFWGEVLGTLPVVMVGHAQAMCVQETTAYMDGTLLEASRAAGSRTAAMGTVKVHRANGSACYDLNLGKGLPRNCGNERTPNPLAEQTPSCRLDFLPVTGDPAKAWITAGRLVRARMPAIPTAFYNDKYVYGLRCDEPLYPKPSATFEQCAAFLRRVAAQTDHSPQVVHLWGWQFKGKDTGYPAVNVVNERIGGYDGMMKLMAEGEANNATVTLSDNYDDAYRSSPEWDERLIARRPDGALWKSRAWTGEESYILGLAKYMEGPGAARVRYTCERYKLKHTTHIDVLSYYAIRNDWDPAKPASAILNLREGRYKVVDLFRSHGVDVSSEALRYPMIGHISCYWYLTGPGPCPFGGTAIPLVPQIYGRSAVWGLSGAGAKGAPEFVRILERFYGAAPHSMMLHDTDPAQFLDAFYLGMVPFYVLRGRSIEDFERTGDSTRVHLEGGAVIESDLTAKSLRVTLHGMEVLRDDAVYCPLVVEGDTADTTKRIACYSVSPRSVEVALPRGWTAGAVKAIALHADSREDVAVSAKGGSLSLKLEARTPVILYRDAHAAGEAMRRA